MNGKWVLLVGVNGGLGAPTALSLIDKGYEVIGIDCKIDEEKWENVNIHCFECDITNEESIQKLKLEVTKLTFHLYAVINLAGIFLMQSIIEGSKEDLQKIINVNFFGVYNINKAFFEFLSSGSRIINMSSEVADYSPQPFMAYYSMTKKMVKCYSDVLRRECNYLGIKVITIFSGAMKTKMLDKANNEYDLLVANTKHFKKQYEKLKFMMDHELTKTNNPALVSKKIVKVLEQKNPKIYIKIKRSFALRMMNVLPVKLQDIIYKKVI